MVMAVSLTTATLLSISIRDSLGVVQKLGTLPSFHTKLRFKNQRSFLIQSSSDAASEAATTVDSDSESSVEASKPPSYSLISALNVEKALRGIVITDVDHYGRLGLQRGCPYEQVGAAYKNISEKLKAQGLEEEELNKKMELLKESYFILSNQQERRLYDWSLERTGKSGGKSDKYVWPFEVDIAPITTLEPPPGEPEDVGPTRLVGYFLLSWLLLGATLSIVLNR